MSSDNPVYTGPPTLPHVSLDDVHADASRLPEGTIPHVVVQGDTLYDVAIASGYGNPPDMGAFYAKNEEFQQRNPDLIYPGEVVFVKPPANGTAQNGQVDANGDPQFQNYSGGEAVGDPYVSQVAENGQPVNQLVIDANGGAIRTGADGAPLTGWVITSASDAVNGPSTFGYYVNGRQTTATYTGRDAPSTPPSDDGGTEFGTNEPVPADFTGWVVTAGSSSGAAYTYFDQGHQIDNSTVYSTEGQSRAPGDPPPNLDPPTA